MITKKVHINRNDQIVTLQIVVANLNAQQATGIVTTITYPTGVSFSGATVPHGSYNQFSKVWTLDYLDQNDPKSMFLNLRVDNIAVQPFKVYVAVTANEFDIDLSNNNMLFVLSKQEPVCEPILECNVNKIITHSVTDKEVTESVDPVKDNFPSLPPTFGSAFTDVAIGDPVSYVNNSLCKELVRISSTGLFSTEGALADGDKAHWLAGFGYTSNLPSVLGNTYHGTGVVNSTGAFRKGLSANIYGFEDSFTNDFSSYSEDQRVVEDYFIVDPKQTLTIQYYGGVTNYLNSTGGSEDATWKITKIMFHVQTFKV